ncbi:glycosyltransferase family 39 protein [Microbispora sp. H10670]|uniref:glycosyltransferase family 39 protein n=1 Tax=Microbispora sp. H10670 TaxID=2729108 RepID=UPI0016045060|nr:glycosyltransferase family 39 protein [Microbispora sp. H10670]
MRIRHHAGARPGRSARDAALPAVPALAALLACMWGVRRGSMWQDEATTYVVAGRPLPDLWRTLGNVDAVHGCYYLLLHPLLRLVGDAVPAEVAIRIPSVLATAVAASGVAAIGRRLVSAPAGLYAGLVYGTAPAVVAYGQEGRSYALVGAAVVEATRLLTRALEDPARTRRWIWYSVAVAVACLLNLFAALALVAHAATVSIAARGRTARDEVTGENAGVPDGPRRWGVPLRWAGASACALLAVLPLAWIAFGQRDQVSWLERPGWPEVRALVARFAGSGLSLAATVVLVLLGLTLGLAPGLAPGPTPGRTPGLGDRRANALGLVAVAVPLAVLPPALLIAVSRIHPFYQDRYVLFSMAGLALLTGAGLARAVKLVPGPAPERSPNQSPGRSPSGWRGGWRIAPRAAAAVALPVLLLAASLPDQAAVRRIDSRPDDPAAAARVVGSGRRPGDAVLFLPSIRRLVAEAYPASFDGVRDAAIRAGGAESGTLAGRELPAGDLAAALGAAPRVWVVSRPHPTPADLASARDTAKRDLLREGYRKERAFRVLGYTVRLYTRLSP